MELSFNDQVVVLDVDYCNVSQGEDIETSYKTEFAVVSQQSWFISLHQHNVELASWKCLYSFSFNPQELR